MCLCIAWLMCIPSHHHMRLLHVPQSLFSCAVMKSRAFSFHPFMSDGSFSMSSFMVPTMLANAPQSSEFHALAAQTSLNFHPVARVDVGLGCCVDAGLGCVGGGVDSGWGCLGGGVGGCLGCWAVVWAAAWDVWVVAASWVDAWDGWVAVWVEAWDVKVVGRS